MSQILVKTDGGKRLSVGVDSRKLSVGQESKKFTVGAEDCPQITIQTDNKSFQVGTEGKEIQVSSIPKALTLGVAGPGGATAAGGEANTAANVGTGGFGLVATPDKVGTVIQLRSIGGTGLVEVTEDAGDERVDIGLTVDASGFEAECLATDEVGHFVQVTGFTTKTTVTKVDISTPTTLPAIGVIISKSTSTDCIVQSVGQTSALGTLIAKEKYFIGIDGKITTPAPFPLAGQVRSVQFVGVALSTSVLWLTGSAQRYTRRA